MAILQEELLEPVARYLRFREVIRLIDKSRSISIIDIGSGPNTPFYTFLIKNGFDIRSYTAIDPLSELEGKNIKFIKPPVIKNIPVKTNSLDYVIAIAFIEHIDNPKEVMSEMMRIVKPGGKVIVTTPTPKAKLLLELLSYKLNIISRREIQEHKNYFDISSLLTLIPNKFKGAETEHSYFEFGMNNLFVIIK